MEGVCFHLHQREQMEGFVQNENNLLHFPIRSIMRTK